MLQQKLGRQIAALRRTRNLTQAQLAKLVGCSVDFIGLVERGVNAPTVAKLEHYARVLKVAVTDLFTFDQRKSERIVVRAQKSAEAIVPGATSRQRRNRTDSQPGKG